MLYRYLLRDDVKEGSHLAVKEKVLTETIGLHWHDYIELELVTGGSGSCNLNGQPGRLQRGSLFLLRQTDFHGLTPEPELQIVTLSMDESFLSGQLLDRLKSGVLLSLPEKQAQTVEKLLSLCMEEAGADVPELAYQRHLLECVLLRVLPWIPEGDALGEIPEKPIQAALQHLHLHFRENPSLSRLAQIAHYNTSHFSTVFHKEMGVPYTRYLNVLKTEYAKKLLKQTQLKVSEICQECGFTSHSNFLRLFKQETGLSPTQFRQREKDK